MVEVEAGEGREDPDEEEHGEVFGKDEEAEYGRSGGYQEL